MKRGYLVTDVDLLIVLLLQQFSIHISSYVTSSLLHALLDRLPFFKQIVANAMTEYRRILRRVDLGPGEGVGPFPLLGAIGDVGQCAFYDFCRLPHVLLSIGVGQGLCLGLLPGICSRLCAYALEHLCVSAFLIHFACLLPLLHSLRKPLAVSVLLFLPALGALVYFLFGVQLDEAPGDGWADVLDWRLLIINLHKPILAPICGRLD